MGAALAGPKAGPAGMDPAGSRLKPAKSRPLWALFSFLLTRGRIIFSASKALHSSFSLSLIKTAVSSARYCVFIPFAKHKLTKSNI